MSARRAVLLIIAVLLVCSGGLVALIGVPGLAPLRAPILTSLIRQLDTLIPGSLSFESAFWLQAGSFELRGLRWIDHGDTLADVPRLAVRLQWTRLLGHELVMDSLTVHARSLDLYAIRSRFPADSLRLNPPAKRGFFRPGFIPGFPSLAARALWIEVPMLRVDSSRVRGRLSAKGSLQLLSGQPPSISLRDVELEEPANQWRIEQGRITIDLSGEGRLEASARGQLGPQWPFVLTGTTARDGDFSLSLSRPAGLGPGRGDAISARGRFHRDAGQPLGIDVERYAIHLADLDATGSWRVDGTQHDGRAQLAMRGTGWITLLTPLEGLPDSLAIHLDARLHGRLEALEADLHARGTTIVSGLLFDRASVRAHGTIGRTTHLRFAAAARTNELWAESAGVLDVDPSRVEVRLLAVRLENAVADTTVSRPAQSAAIPTVQQGGRLPVVVSRSFPGPILVRRLLFTGGYGEAELNARAQEQGGTFAGAIRWPRPPEAWLQRMELDTTRLTALRNAWASRADYHAELHGRFGPRVPRVVAEGEFHIPGPAQLTGLLPPGARVEDLGPIEGRGHFEGEVDRWKVTADLARTPWLERFVFTARGDANSFGLEYLETILPGVRATLRTSGKAGATRGTVDVRIEHPEFLSRFVPELRGARLRAAIQGQLHGPLESPALDLGFIAGLQRADLHVPQMSGTARIRAGQLTTFAAVAPRGVTFMGLNLDSAGVEYSSQATTGAPPEVRGPFRMSASGTDLALRQSGIVQMGRQTQIRTDSLSIVVRDRELHTARPFSLTLIERGFELDSLQLIGSMGSVRANGRVTEVRSDLSVNASLTPPEPPAWMRIPAGLVPSRLEARLEPTTGDSLVLEIEARGLQVASHKDLNLRVAMVGRSGQIFGSLVLAGAGDPIIDAVAVIPGRFSVLESSLPTNDGPLQVDARFKDFPLPPGLDDPLRAPGYLDRSGLDRSLALDGLLQLRGTRARPAGTLNGTFTFPGWKELREDRIEVVATMTPAASAADTRAGITATLTGRHKDRHVLDGSLTLPARISLAPAGMVAIDGRSIVLSVTASAFPLQMVEPFAKGLSRLKGSANLQLKASGAPLDPDFEASLTLVGLEARTPERSRISARGGLTGSGKLKTPTIRGRVQIEHGVIILPEQQKLLHPTEGQALLWQGRGVTRSNPPDQIANTTPPLNASAARIPIRGNIGLSSNASGAQEVAQAQHAAFDSLQAGSDLIRALDLNVQIVAPGGTWVRGRGLDIELSGDIQLTQKDGTPSLMGDLETRGGGMELYGRRMDVERGRITFFGGRKLDPALDLTLAKRTSDLEIVAHVTGTAQNPRVEIESNPPLDQSEVLSYLLFDRPLDNLDASQNHRIEERAAGQAEAYLAAQLTGRLSESLGLDLLSYERSRTDSSSNGSPTVTLGKYLTPQLLVKVEQDFSDQRGFDVVLEYWIRRGFKFSTYAKAERSGVRLDWSHDY